jgi:hypothetical protein
VKPIKTNKLIGDLRTLVKQRGLELDVHSGRNRNNVIIYDPETDDSLTLALPSSGTINGRVQRRVLNYLGRLTAFALGTEIFQILMFLFSSRELKLGLGHANGSALDSDTQSAISQGPLALEWLSSREIEETIPVRNFVAGTSKEKAAVVFAAAEQLADYLGYDVTFHGELTEGSWWQDLKLRTRAFFSSDAVKTRADAVEDVLFGHANIDVDFKVVDMTAKLISALVGNGSAAVVDSGAFLFIKTPDNVGSSHIFVKRLTVLDRAILNADPTIVQSPSDVLEKLRDARRLSKNRIDQLINIAEIPSPAIVGDILAEPDHLKLPGHN